MSCMIAELRLTLTGSKVINVRVSSLWNSLSVLNIFLYSLSSYVHSRMKIECSVCRWCISVLAFDCFCLCVLQLCVCVLVVVQFDKVGLMLFCHLVFGHWSWRHHQKQHNAEQIRKTNSSAEICNPDYLGKERPHGLCSDWSVIRHCVRNMFGVSPTNGIFTPFHELVAFSVAAATGHYKTLLSCMSNACLLKNGLCQCFCPQMSFERFLLIFSMLSAISCD